MSEKITRRAQRQRDVQELLDLYHAWFGVLLRHLGKGEHRIPQKEISQGLMDSHIHIRKEGDDYVISVSDSERWEEKEDTYAQNT